jgi:hypothetical protein
VQLWSDLPENRLPNHVSNRFIRLLNLFVKTGLIFENAPVLCGTGISLAVERGKLMSQTGLERKTRGLRQWPIMPDLVLWQMEDAGPSSPFFFVWGGVETKRDSQRFMNETAGDAIGTDFANSGSLRLPSCRRVSQASSFDVDRLLSQAKRLEPPIDETDDHDDSLLGFSTTALFEKTRKMSDPARYAESSEVPFLTLSSRKSFRFTGIGLGDWATVVHPRSGRYRHAIIGDIRDMPGVDPSSYVSKSLGLTSRESPVYLLYPGTGAGQGSIPSNALIEARGDMLFRRRASQEGPTWAETLAEFLAFTPC